MMHVSYETFWHLNPRKLKPIEKAYSMEMESKQNAMNLDAWLHGVYVSHSVASVMSKNAKYPKKPFELFSSHKKTVQEEGMEFEKYVQQFNIRRKSKPITC